MDFKQLAKISSFLSKDYAEKIFELILAYKDISASEAASRLGLHIRTVQDFLETMAQFDILNKIEIIEKKRPYNRYSLKKNKIELSIDIQKELELKSEIKDVSAYRIREKNNSGAKFSVSRTGDFFSTVTFWIGKNRMTKERKINLTNAQGTFLYYLPFPDASPLTIDEIIEESSIEPTHKKEIINLLDELIEYEIIEKII